LTIVSASPRSGTDGKPSLKGAWLVHVKHLNFGGPNHISDGTAAGVDCHVDHLTCCQVRWKVSVIVW